LAEKLKAASKRISPDGKKELKNTQFLKIVVPSEDIFFESTVFLIMCGETYKYRALFPRLHEVEQNVPGTDIILPRLQGTQKAKFVSAKECSDFVSTLRSEGDPMAAKFKGLDGKVSENRTHDLFTYVQYVLICVPCHIYMLL